MQRLSQVEIKEYDHQNDKNHPTLKYISVQFVALNLLVSFGITQPLSLIVHDPIDLLVEFLVVGVIASHDDAPHDQPNPSSQHSHDHMQDVISFLFLGGEYK